MLIQVMLPIEDQEEKDRSFLSSLQLLTTYWFRFPVHGQKIHLSLSIMCSTRNLIVHIMMFGQSETMSRGQGRVFKPVNIADSLTTCFEVSHLS